MTTLLRYDIINSTICKYIWATIWALIWVSICTTAYGQTGGQGDGITTDQLERAPGANYILKSNGDSILVFMPEDSLSVTAQNLNLQDSLLKLTGQSTGLVMGAANDNEIVITDPGGNIKKYVFRGVTIPLLDQQQLSIDGSSISLSNGGTVDLSALPIVGGVDTIYADGNEIKYTIDGVLYSIFIESCDYCAPVTLTPNNSVDITETISISDNIETDTSNNTLTVVITNNSGCSTLRGYLWTRAKLEIYGHQTAQYTAWIEYRVDGGTWTKINESEAEIYRNAGNYEETIRLSAQIPISLTTGNTDTYDTRVILQTLDIGYGSLFVVVDDATTALWKTTALSMDFLLTNHAQ